MKPLLFIAALLISPILGASVVSAQSLAPAPALRAAPILTTGSRSMFVPPSGASAASSFANQSANLRAAPLPADSLAKSSATPAKSVYSMPYGPNLSRRSGSPIVPFGSSRYYYHR